MDHPGAVHRLEAAQRLDAELDRQRHREGPLGRQPVADVFAFDVLPDHEEAAVGQAGEVVEDGDVRVLDLGGDARFLGEALDGGRVGHPVLAQDLDDPLVAEVDVAGAVDLAHPAGTEAGEDLVLAFEDGAARLIAHSVPGSGDVE